MAVMVGALVCSTDEEKGLKKAAEVVDKERCGEAAAKPTVASLPRV